MLPLYENRFVTGTEGQLRVQHSAYKSKYRYQGILFDFGLFLSRRISFSDSAEKQNKRKE
jgi:hypothetical protein